jgi:DNA polymerase-3 subunit chi
LAEVVFYHLTQTPLERTLPDLLEKSLQRGWRVLVKGGNAERLALLDTTLWTYRDDSFLPHGMAEEDAAHQPIYLTTSEEEPNNADILFLVEGAKYPFEKMSSFARVCVLFDGNDTSALNAAREDWKATTAAKLPAKYWAQEDGRWLQKAENLPAT